MIDQTTTVRYGNSSGYVRLATGLESAVRDNFRSGPVGYTVDDNENGTASVTITGTPEGVEAVAAWLDGAF